MAKISASNTLSYGHFLAAKTTQNYMNLLTEQFSAEYSTTWMATGTGPTTFVIKPKDNPSTLSATLFPMFKTRFKYVVVFQDTGRNGTTVTYKDAYAQNFSRVNGTTSEQQQRIADRNKDVEERLKRVQASLASG